MLPNQLFKRFERKRAEDLDPHGRIRPITRRSFALVPPGYSPGGPFPLEYVI